MHTPHLFNKTKQGAVYWLPTSEPNEMANCQEPWMAFRENGAFINVDSTLIAFV